MYVHEFKSLQQIAVLTEAHCSDIEVPTLRIQFVNTILYRPIHEIKYIPDSLKQTRI